MWPATQLKFIQTLSTMLIPWEHPTQQREESQTYGVYSCAIYFEEEQDNKITLIMQC